jgi:hypothetical protein
MITEIQMKTTNQLARLLAKGGQPRYAKTVSAILTVSGAAVELPK